MQRTLKAADQMASFILFFMRNARTEDVDDVRRKIVLSPFGAIFGIYVRSRREVLALVSFLPLTSTSGQNKTEKTDRNARSWTGIFCCLN